MTHSKAIRIHEFGGPEVLEENDVELAPPGPGQAIVLVEFAGVNFIDIFQREGVGRQPEFPMGIGVEGAGTVVEVGPGVADVEVGDRVAWQMVSGSYATHVQVVADRLIRVPDDLTTQIAAASVLQGLTAHCLVSASYQLSKGDVCLVRAAAGGVSLFLCQLAKRVGAEVIGTVSTQAKAAAAREAGADHVFLNGEGNLVDEVRRVTGGEGVHVVYDGVGKDTFDTSLECLRRDGHLVLYGQASGAVPPLDLRRLAAKALHATRGGLGAYAADHASMAERARELFAWVAAGEVIVQLDQTFALAAAARAHERLADRASIGKILLATA